MIIFCSIRIQLTDKYIVNKKLIGNIRNSQNNIYFEIFPKKR